VQAFPLVRRRTPCVALDHSGPAPGTSRAARPSGPSTCWCRVRSARGHGHSSSGDSDEIPLLLSVDTATNETSSHPDHIVPDVLFLDGQFGFVGRQVGALTQWGAGPRKAVVEPLPDRTDDGRAVMMETGRRADA